MAESKDVTAPNDCTSFLEFADRLNIPINQEYLSHIGEQIKAINQFDLDALDVGIKDSKTHEKFNERRIQNALWRAWWRQRSTRFKTGQKRSLFEEDQQLESVDDEMKVLWGSEIGDIPTEYTIPDDLEPHELPVIGTYVDPYVIPGFSYRVRFCGSNQDYLFGGKAMRLERIGPGYGKRLTFEDHDILDCDNFFWSDSNPEGGFAFSINVGISAGQRFKAFDFLNREVAEILVGDVDSRSQVLSSRIDDSGTTLDVGVNFRCNAAFLTSDDVPESLRGKTSVLSLTGKAKMIKVRQKKSAVMVEITEVPIPGVGCCVLREA